MQVDQDHRLTGAVIGACVDVHRELGPGEDEIAYEQALSLALSGCGIPHTCQLAVPLFYKGTHLDCGFRLDTLVDTRLPVELKAVEALLPIHSAQVLTYLRLCEMPLGLLINFEVPLLRNGIRRLVLTRPVAPPPDENVFPRQPGDPVADELIRGAFEVHHALGPGLLKSAYEECLCRELFLRGIQCFRGHRHPLHFRGVPLKCESEVPLLVDNRIPVQCMSVSKLSPIHDASMIARLRNNSWPFGYVLNFNVRTLAAGIRRIIHP